MSFSREIKEELSMLNNWNQPEQLKAELNGYYMSSNTSASDEKIYFVTENNSNLERYQKILKNLGIPFTTSKKGKIFQTQYCNEAWLELANIDIEDKEILSTFQQSYATTANVNKRLSCIIRIMKE